MPDGEYLSTEDYKALGSFPQDYNFGDSDDTVSANNMAQYLVGMSVPPSMTAHIADEIWRQWLS